jgi:hypothetical protein
MLCRAKKEKRVSNRLIGKNQKYLYLQGRIREIKELR